MYESLAWQNTRDLCKTVSPEVSADIFRSPTRNESSKMILFPWYNYWYYWYSDILLYAMEISDFCNCFFEGLRCGISWGWTSTLQESDQTINIKRTRSPFLQPGHIQLLDTRMNITTLLKIGRRGRGFTMLRGEGQALKKVNDIKHFTTRNCRPIKQKPGHPKSSPNTGWR